MANGNAPVQTGGKWTGINWGQLKQKTTNNYNSDYWNSKYSSFVDNASQLQVDAQGNVGYLPSNTEVPSLTQAWSQYLKGAQSRGVKPDFLTFKQQYDALKQERTGVFVKNLETAKLMGANMNSIHELVRDNPELGKEIVEAMKNSPDMDTRAFIQEFYPGREMTLASVAQDYPGTTALVGAGLGLGAAYAFGTDPAMIAEAAKGLSEAEKAITRKTPPSYKTGKNVQKQWMDKNPKTGKYTASKAGKIRYEKVLSDYNSSQDVLKKAKAKFDVAGKTRAGRWASGWKQPRGGLGAGIGRGTIMAASPFLVESAARKVGLDASTARKLGAAAGVGTSVYYLRAAAAIPHPVGKGIAIAMAAGFGIYEAIRFATEGKKKTLGPGAVTTGTTYGPMRGR